jgi:hypothetical protein
MTPPPALRAVSTQQSLYSKSADLYPIKFTSAKRGQGRDDDLISMIYGVGEPQTVRKGQGQGRLSRYEAEFTFQWGRIESSASVYQTKEQATTALRQQARSCRADPPATSVVKTRLKLGQLTIACFVLRLDFGLLSLRWADGNVLASVSVWEDHVYNYGQTPTLARKQAIRIQRLLVRHR